MTSNKATLRNVWVIPTSLRPGDTIVLRNFVRTVTEVTYAPVEHQVLVSCDYSTSYGSSSEVIRVSAYENIKKLEPVT